MSTAATRKASGAKLRRPTKTAKRTTRRPAAGSAIPGEKVVVPPGGLFAGREYVFGALSFKPVKGATAKRLVHARILADHHT